MVRSRTRGTVAAQDLRRAHVALVIEQGTRKAVQKEQVGVKQSVTCLVSDGRVDSTLRDFTRLFAQGSRHNDRLDAVPPKLREPKNAVGQRVVSDCSHVEPLLNKSLDAD